MSLLLKSLKQIEAPAAETNAPEGLVSPPAPTAIAPSSPIVPGATDSEFPIVSPAGLPQGPAQVLAQEQSLGPVVDESCDSSATEFAADISVDYDEMTEIVAVEEIIYGLDESEDTHATLSDCEASFDATPDATAGCEPPPLNPEVAAEALPSPAAAISENITAKETYNFASTPESASVDTPAFSESLDPGIASSTLDRLNELSELIGASLATTPEEIVAKVEADNNREEPPPVKKSSYIINPPSIEQTSSIEEAPLNKETLAVKEPQLGVMPSSVEAVPQKQLGADTTVGIIETNGSEEIRTAEPHEQGETFAVEQFTDYAPRHRADIALANSHQAPSGTPSLRIWRHNSENCAAT